MPIQPPQPPAEQPSPYLPPGPEPLIFEDFESINTSNTRAGIDDKQMWWCSGFYPYGTRDLRTLPGIGPVLWTSPGPGIVFYGFANIGALPVAIVFLADGSIWQVATTTGAAINIATSGTIPNPSILTSGMSQWGSQYVLIVTNQRPNGYFVWDGTLLYQAGSLAPGVTITNVGGGYTSVPTVSISGGSGSGATFVVTLNQTGGIVGSSGNYGGFFTAPSGTVTIVGGGGTGATAILNFVPSGSGYTVASVAITNQGSGYSGSPQFSYASSYMVAAPNYVPVVGTTGTVASITITNPGSGYVVGDTPTLSINGGGGGSATATVTIMPFGVLGTDIETYAGRAWLINGALLQFAAPGSFTNFSTASGGGSVTSSDSFLRVGYVRLIQTNGFLYLIGDSSINYISGVQTSGSPPTTTYTNQNADPEVGTPYPQTADVFGRNIVLANSVGVHVMYGAAATKISEPLDGVYNTVPNFNGAQLSAAKATIFGKKTWIVLVPIIDPVTNQLSNELFMSVEPFKKWFSSKQDVSLTFIQYQEINSVLTAWGTDGGRIFQLFAQPSVGFTKTVQSKLYTKAGGYQFRKSAGRLWGIIQYNGVLSPNFTVTIDNEVSSATYVIVPPTTGMTWTTQNGTVMNWTTAGALAMTWTTSQIGLRTFGPQAVGQNGTMLGFTAQTVAADAALVSLMMDDQITQYRG
jgi:hypothetical protein